MHIIDARHDRLCCRCSALGLYLSCLCVCQGCGGPSDPGGVEGPPGAAAVPAAAQRRDAAAQGAARGNGNPEGEAVVASSLPTECRGDLRPLFTCIRSNLHVPCHPPGHGLLISAYLPCRHFPLLFTTFPGHTLHTFLGHYLGHLPGHPLHTFLGTTTHLDPPPRPPSSTPPLHPSCQAFRQHLQLRRQQAREQALNTLSRFAPLFRARMALLVARRGRLREERAATLIQACVRGWRQRQRTAVMVRGITRLQVRLAGTENCEDG